MEFNEDNDLFSPYSILENLKKSNLDPSIFDTIDESDFAKAPNFLEFATGPQFLNTLILPKQLQIGSYLFCDFCPRCSKPKYIDNLFDQTMGEIRDNVTFLEHGVCPVCKTSRYELVRNKELVFKNELVGVMGQRCVPENSLVASDKGLIPMKEVDVGDVLTHGPVIGKIDSGLLPCLKLTTKYGYEAAGSRDSHVIAMIKQGGDAIEYVPISECHVGDMLLLSKSGLFPKTPYAFNRRSAHESLVYPNRMSAPLAKFLGILYSKCFMSYDALYFGKHEIACYADFNMAHRECFQWPLVFSVAVDNDKKSLKCSFFPYVVNWLEKTAGFSLSQRTMPECVLRSTREHAEAFVLAFLGVDRLRASRKKIVFDPLLHTKDFIRQFRLLLLNLGWVVEKIGDCVYCLRSPKSSLKSIPKQYLPVPIERIEEIEPCQMMDVQIPDSNVYVADGFLHHNSGKTKLVALIASYVNHRFLKIPSPVRTYNQTSGDVLMGTFSALSIDHSFRNLWQSFKGFMDSSPWFQNYHRFLRNEEKRLGIELFHELKTSMFYMHKHLLWNATGSQDRKMRGDTRIFAAIDELGWMISEEGKKDLQNMNADAIYTALTNSLTTMRTKYNQVWGPAMYDIPPIIMANISSPSSAKDKIMRLAKDAKRNDRIYAVHLPTWWCNPDYTYETLREEHAHVDEITFNRDFGAEPPLAASPFLSEARLIDKIAIGPVFDNFTVSETTQKDFLGDYFKSVKLDIRKGDKVVPRLLSFDLGSFKNSLAVCMFSLTPESRPRLDFALAVRPDPKTKVRVNIAEFFENFTVPLVNNFKIRHAFFDRWQSLDQIERLKQKNVEADVHSLTYKEMDSIRGSIISQSIVIPKMEKKVEEYVREYIEDVAHTDALSLLGLQLLTVRDLGHKMAKPLLGDDDVFRAFCLGAVKIMEESIKKEYTSNGAVKTNSGLTVAHLGVVRTRREMAGGGRNFIEGDNGKCLGTIRSRYKK